MINNTIKKVGILRGMAGEDYESSLKKGGEIILHILENLKDKWKPVDVFIDKDYAWHYDGVPVSPSDLAHRVDLAWNTSHPSLSNILESFSIPNIGVSSFSALLEKNRDMLREHAKKADINMPRHVLVSLYQKDIDGSKEKFVIRKAREVFEKFGAPWIVKSFTPDSNMGIHVAKTFDELARSIDDGVTHEKSILVEEFIDGKAVSAHSVPKFRGEHIYVFPPNNFSADESKKSANTIRNLHDHIGAKHYLKSDFILHPRRGFFLTGIGLLPDLKKGSHFEKSCESVGARMHHVIEHILNNALEAT